jgi:hypothetical protein
MRNFNREIHKKHETNFRVVGVFRGLNRLFENLGEEQLHVFPRTFVGALVAGRAFGVIVTHVPLGVT